jgi:2-polyprenyl-6-methoxyphenol hydroxylase-like FAD-dependent oxidoreductase
VLLGCDGIHSTTRLTHVEPSRKSIYSGVCNAFGFAKRPLDQEVHFECAAINFGRRGMLLTSFHEPTHESVYVGALMQVPEVGSRDGWKAAGADQVAVKADIAARFGETVLPALVPLIENADDFFLWPVFTLAKGGKWCTGRSMLLGDAAHAMPPQGEATGIVFEDTVLFARCLMRWVELGQEGGMEVPFAKYEALRRGRIDVAFEESKKVVDAVSDAGWLGHKIKTLVIPWFLWWTVGNRVKHFIEDVTTSDLGF